MPPLRLSTGLLPRPRKRAWPRLLHRIEWVAAKLHPENAPTAAHALGRQGEEMAYWLLRQHGYTIIARNFRGSAGFSGARGEIDLIALEGAPPTLVFVEVKTREKEGLFPAERAVHHAKRQHLIRLARAYRRRKNYCGPYRFDVVVIYRPGEENPRLKLHRNAFRG